MHTRLDTSSLPGKRQVIHLRFTDDPRPYWVVVVVVVELGVPSVCRSDPGFGVDVTVVSDVRSLYQVWLGRIPLRAALRQGIGRFDGLPAFTRRMAEVLQLSPVAPMVAAAMGTATE
jgi:hypothetical protein